MKDVTETTEFKRFSGGVRESIVGSGIIHHLRIPTPIFADMVVNASAELIRAGQLGHAQGIEEVLGAVQEDHVNVPNSPATPSNPFTRVSESALSGLLGHPVNYSNRGKTSAWFDWPKGVEAKLYTRDGADMTDHDKNGLDDHRINVDLVDAVEWALSELLRRLGKAEFFKQGWHVFGGGVNIRSKKGGSGWSTHSWGLALDFNPNENVFYASSTTFTHTAIEVWHEAGFYWGPYAWGCPNHQAKHRRGGRQSNLWIDPMHVQAVKPSIYEGTYYETQGFPNG